MKSLFLGILLIILIGLGGLLFRNTIEHPAQPIACPTISFVCPDGTFVSPIGSTCDFPACPPPNITLSSINISFALPVGFAATTSPDSASVITYELPISASTTNPADIVIRDYAIQASSTALATIQQTAIGNPSGLPVSVTSFSSTILGNHRFTVVSIQRFEGVIDTAYYLARANDVVRFDAVDYGTNWTNPDLDISTLPAHTALTKLLATLQGE